MMSELKEFEGRTAAEAAINACNALGTTRSQLKYELKSDEGEGLDRRVVISVDVAAIEPAPEEEARPERPRRERNHVMTEETVVDVADVADVKDGAIMMISWYLRKRSMRVWMSCLQIFQSQSHRLRKLTSQNAAHWHLRF